MIPSQFVQLDAFPLTPHRKVDRSSLPALASIEAEREYVPPSSDVERVVAEVIADALGIESPGVHDDFFELGGHSLHATRVLAELESTFGIAIPMRTFFTRPTIAAIADNLTSDPECGGKIPRIAELKVRLASMSAEEVEQMLAARRGGGEQA
jgi:acyl carrier protein